MKQEIVLPKFKVPGQRNWLVTGLWIAGAVVLLQAVIVGAILWRHQGKDIGNGANAEGAQALGGKASPEAAPAAAKAAPAANAAPAAVKPRQEKPVLANQNPVAAKAALAGKPHARGGHGLRKKSARSGKLLARSAAGRASARPAKAAAAKPARGKGGDAIDEILKKFK
jgi:hypothetical protein